MPTSACDVLHQPQRHPYVRGLGVGGRIVDSSVWDAASLRRRRVRIVHLHFGFEHLSVERLANWVDELGRERIGLVHTVHDLDNPHLVDQQQFHRQIGIVVDAADALMTLTPTVADAVGLRFGRRPCVVAHPRLVPRLEIERRAGLGKTVRTGIYVHAATCRPNLDLELLARIGPAAPEFGGLLIHARRSVPRTTLDQLARIAGDSGGRLTIGERLTDGELWDHLSQAKAVVLPYRWGTHSGLLEAAHDLGTPVLAPSLGGFADQGARLLDRHDPVGSLYEAINEPAVPAAHRRRLQAEIGAAHRRVYAEIRARLA